VKSSKCKANASFAVYLSYSSLVQMFGRAEINQMFLAWFCKRDYLRGKAVPANHVPPTSE